MKKEYINNLNEFKINFFELMFLAETCIPPVPIARNMFFNNLTDVYFNELNNSQRIRLFECITKNNKFDLKNKDCKNFYLRFNPENQYIVNTKESSFNAYLKDNEYYIKIDVSIIKDYIISVKKT